LLSYGVDRVDIFRHAGRYVDRILRGAKPSNLKPFREGLATFGWVEGRNLRLDYRFSGDDPSRLAAYAEELVNLRPDVIFALSGWRPGLYAYIS
jgi:ABC-type uncharacterized transport system substrate-binding protein